MNNPFISSIIVVYRSENYINKCIVSLQNAALYAKIKLEIIIIVNDIENKNYSFFKKNVRILKNKSNVGFVKAADQGASIAKGEWFLFINPDTLTLKNTLVRMSSFFCNNKISIIAPKVVNNDGSIQPNILPKINLSNSFLEQSYLYKILPRLFKHPQSDQQQYNYTHYVNAVSGVYLLIRKESYKRIEGFDKRLFMYFEDVDLCKRIRDKGYKIIFIHNAIIYHYNHGSSNGYQMSEIYLDSFTKYLSKYHRKPYILIALFLYLFGTLQRLIYFNIAKIVSKEDDKKLSYGKKIYFYTKLLKYLTGIILF